MSGGTQPLLEALKAVAVALKQAGVSFALAGGFAVYARGGQRSTNDVDFVVPEEDSAAARQALQEGGFEVLQPPEDWLFKARREATPVDVIFRLPTGPVGGDHRLGILDVGPAAQGPIRLGDRREEGP